MSNCSYDRVYFFALTQERVVKAMAYFIVLEELETIPFEYEFTKVAATKWSREYVKGEMSVHGNIKISCGISKAVASFVDLYGDEVGITHYSWDAAHDEYRFVLGCEPRWNCDEPANAMDFYMSHVSIEP